MMKRILIVGGGIAGLTLAKVLQSTASLVEVVEKTATWKPLGAGIMLHANAMAVLSSLGLNNKIAQLGRYMPAIELTDQHGKPLQMVNLAQLEKHYGPSYSIHRADLHQTLLDACSDIPIHLGEAVTAITQTKQKVEVQFISGRKEMYDIVIGADGLHSQVRSLAFKQIPIKPIYAGYSCWRYVCDDQTQLKHPIEMWGQGARVGLVPLTKGRLYVYLTLNTLPNQPKQDTLTNLFAQFGSFAQVALRCYTPDIPLLHHDLMALSKPVWYNQRVALVGDAAHAITPNMGQGAAQAIESAWVLGQMLIQHSDGPTALAYYRQAREKRVNLVRNRSQQIGTMAQWSNPWISWLRNWAIWLTPAALGTLNMKQILEPGVQLAKQTH